MINNLNFISIREIASRLSRHPLMAEITIEPIIQYTLDFISIVGLPMIYEDKYDEVNIINYRGALPCGLVKINQVRNQKNGIPMRSMTDNFSEHPFKKEIKTEDTFKTRGEVIFTSFKEGKVGISYESIQVDQDGLPLIPDDGSFLKTLELYIKKEYFTILNDLGKIPYQTLFNTQKEYAFRVGNLTNKFKMPSTSEMQSITGILNQFFTRSNEFGKGFRDLGNKEFIKQH